MTGLERVAIAGRMEIVLRHPVPATVGNLSEKVPHAKLRENHTLASSILMDCLLIG